MVLLHTGFKDTNENAAGGRHSDEEEDGVCHLRFGGAVPGDGGRSLQVPGAAS